MTAENTTDWRKKLRYRAWHRGSREMDLIMGSFADTNLSQLSDTELQEFENLLDLADDDLYAWYAGRQDPPANLDGPVLRAYLRHKACDR